MESARVDRRWIGGAVASILGCGVWVALAWHSPTTTYHLAPALPTFAWPVFYSLGGEAKPTPRLFWLAVLGGTTLAALTLVVLQWRDLLLGPTVIDRGPAYAEVILVVLISVAGLALSRYRSNIS